MNNCEWIVCEATSRWAAALRLALARNAWYATRGFRLFETRQLDALASRLVEQPESFAAIEVRDTNVGDVLAWLPRASVRYWRARFVALLDRSLSQRDTNNSSTQRITLGDLREALCEAGAADVAPSPRRLTGIVELGRRHAQASSRAAGWSGDSSFPAQVLASLPWQAPGSRVV